MNSSSTPYAQCPTPRIPKWPATQRSFSPRYLSLSQLTVKMAPTIEYPAQQCDVSPKSLHIVLFYYLFVVFWKVVLNPGSVVATAKRLLLNLFRDSLYRKIDDDVGAVSSSIEGEVRCLFLNGVLIRLPSWRARGHPRWIKNILK